MLLQNGHEHHKLDLDLVNAETKLLRTWTGTFGHRLPHTIDNSAEFEILNIERPIKVSSCMKADSVDGKRNRQIIRIGLSRCTGKSM